MTNTKATKKGNLPKKASRKRKASASVFDAIDLLEKQDKKKNGGGQVFGGVGHERKEKLLQQRSRAAQSQLRIYRRLLECRILLQRALQQPHPSVVKTSSNSGQNHNSKKQEVDRTAAINQCNQLLTQLLKARNQLQNDRGHVTEKSGNVDQYEEIFCPPKRNDEAGKTVDDNDNDNDNDNDVTRRTSRLLQAEYEKHREEWKEVLNRRHRNIRLHSGALTAAKSQQFSSTFSSSFWQQVDATAQHHRQQHQQQQLNALDDQEHDRSLLSFDDTKVYQQLLKEFVSTSDTNMSSTTGATAVGGLASANIGKSKKKMSTSDRRASKGRKIRYTEIPKLVNFTFPVSKQSSTKHDNLLDEDEWFRSLFGGAAYKNKSQSNPNR